MSAEILAGEVGVQPACTALGVSRATFYRRRRPTTEHQQPRPIPARALSEAERESVIVTLGSDRFVDRAPAEVVATLLDEQKYLCSERTMYRILAAEAPVRERRNQRRHPVYAKPELVATAPNRVWSWDITKLKGPQTWTRYYLYVLLDIFSRYVVGWLIADRETTALAKELIKQSYKKQNIQPGRLTTHSDNGPQMISHGTAQLLARLSVTRSLSRPHTPNDNPFSEAHFKTLKYHPGFPARFGSIEDARIYCRRFFTWYNAEHRHSGLAMFTPEDVHYGRSKQKLEHRRDVLEAAFRAHPERFVRGQPIPSPTPTEAWINAPMAPGAQSDSGSQ